ncbi:MAG TPA: PEP-CTERM sorting domain-containing protein [Verrucomicrobiae bacterium]|nr:PEP-CTERM sorting domain-containing protein [Verrucomicrobiae bacterium]
MKTSLKTTMLAVAGMALMIDAAHAQYAAGDLVAGFTSGSGNDVIYDLGQFSNFSNGETWNLLSALTSSPGGYANLNGLNWGVVGAQSTGLNSALKTVYSTVAHGQSTAPVNIPNTSTFNGIATSVNTIGQWVTAGSPAGIIASSDPASWNGETIVGGSGTFFNNYGSATPSDPNSATPASFTSGSVVEDLYGVKANNTAATLLGTFTLSSTGVLTFNAVAVPEPSTYGVLAGLGLLAVCLRRQLGLFGKA